MGFYKTTLNKDFYSNLYIDRITDYCSNNNIPTSDTIVKSFVIWMCINGYINIDDHRTYYNNLIKIFKISEWILESIKDIKDDIRHYSNEQLFDDSPVFGTYCMCPSGRIMLLPYNPCFRGKKNAISREFDLNKKTLKGLCEICGFTYKQKGSKFKAEACFYDIKKI